MPSTWAPVVFWILLVPLLIVMLIVYLRSKKFNRLVYILSVFTYAMTIMYWIDSYRLGRNAIVALLVASSLLMIYIGTRMRKVKKTKKPNMQIAIGALAAIAVIVAISAVPIGWSIEKTAVQSVSLDDISPVIEEGKPVYQKGTPVYTISVKNSWIPRQYELPEAQACLYNSQQKAYEFANVYWDVKGQRSDFGPQLDVMELGREEKTATLMIGTGPQIRPMPLEKTNFERQVFDTLYLFLDEDGKEYVECYNLQPAQLEKAVRIPVV